MSVSVTLTDTGQRFPSGTAVGVYPAGAKVAGQPPSGGALTTATAGASSVTFAGLNYDTEYVAYATVSGSYNYLSFRTGDPPATTGGTDTFLVAGGNSGSAYTLDCSGHLDILLTLTLTANCTVTLANVLDATRVRMLVTQDATGGRTLAISDGSNSSAVTIPTGPGEFAAVHCDCPAAGTIYVSPLSVPGQQGIQGVQGIQGTQGVSGGGAAFVDPNNFLAVSADMLVVSATGSQPPSGTMMLTKVPVTVGFTCSKIVVQIQTAGAGLTSGQCFAGIYNSSGTLVGQTADQAASWASAGAKAMSLNSSVALTAGFYWVALLAVGTTRPTFFCASSSSLTNLNATATTARAGAGPTAQTSLPATITPASISLGVPVFAIGLA